MNLRNVFGARRRVVGVTSLGECSPPQGGVGVLPALQGKAERIDF